MFSSNLLEIGQPGGGGSDMMMEGSANRMGQQLIEEEKRLIDKVFNIIDRDKSGTIETDELKGMLKDMGFEAQVTSAVERIMQNVDKDNDGKIGRQEFYDLLSAKLGPDDSDQEILGVFRQFDRNGDNKIDVNELQQVASQLGDSIPYEELKAMIKEFATPGEEFITKEKFLEIMKQSLVTEEENTGGNSPGGGMGGVAMM